MKLSRIHSFLFAAFTLPGIWSFAQAPSKVDSIHYFHSSGTPSLSSPTPLGKLFVRDSVPGSSSCTRQIKKAELKAYVYMGDTYTHGSNTFSADVTLKIDAYTTFIGTSTLFNTYWVKLAINQGKPEELWLRDFTADHATIDRFEVTVASYTAPGGSFNADIQLGVFYDEDYGVNVSGVSIANNNVTIDNPSTFKWTRGNCKDITNYQFQVLRLYNTDATLTTDTQIKPLVDWNQALSIETGSSDTTLTLTLTEGRGYYVWRVRPIGTYYPEGIADWRNWGSWSQATYGQGYNSTISANNLPHLFFYYQFDDTLNWIYSRTFSEGDPANPKVRMSEKMTYANGLQQVKQNQAHLFSEDQVLVNQTVYDWSGRAALTTLAAPDSVYDTLGYRNNFIKNGSNLYSALYFDEDTNFRDPNPITNSRLSRYYGNANSDVYVPNSENFPFSRALYERDGTGRVKEQGGPGKTHRIRQDSIHTTRTFYSAVSDRELVRIFGDEAPEATSVHKVINVDANDVASVTYVGKEGQTIATCLAIASDSMGTILDTLPSQGSARFTVNDTIWGKAPLGSPYSGIVSSKPLAFTVPTVVTFDYVIHAKEIEHLCANYCSTCDYLIDILVVSDDTTIKAMSHLLPAESCTSAVSWDTTFARTLQPGSYFIEKRVYANNLDSASIDTASTAGKTFLQQHLDSLYSILSDRAADSLNTIYYYLHQSDMDSLYIYLGVVVDTVSDPETVFADSVIYVNIGCDSISIPITVCSKYKCPGGAPDFEGYFNKRWVGTHHVGTSSGFLKYFKNVKSLGGTGAPGGGGYRPGEFNAVVEEMIDDGYNCEELWTCWDRVTQGYATLDTVSDTSSYNLDLLREFLNCTGTIFTGWGSSAADTNKFKHHPYEYFYYTFGNSPLCDTMMGLDVVGDTAGWGRDTIHIANIQQQYLSLRNCTESLQQPGNQTVATGTAAAQCGCMNICELRYESFKLGIIQMYHNDSIYVEDDQYYLKKDTIWGQEYGWSITPLPGGFSNFIPMDEINCAAWSLVEHCKEYCQLTVFGNVDSVGTPGQRDSMQMAMTWNFQLERGPGCSTGFDTIAPPSGSDTSFVKIWEQHYGASADDALWDMVEAKNGCGGYLMVGHTDNEDQNDVSDSLCGSGTRDWWAIRVNQDGKKLWDVSLGGPGQNAGSISDFETATSVIETQDGGFLIGGYSNSDSACEKSDSSRWNSIDYWAVKIDNLGNVQWNKTYGGTGYDAIASVWETRDGHFLLAGNSATALASGEKSDANCSGSLDFWVIKTRKDGSIVWDTVYGTSVDEEALSVIRETNEGNYVIGATSSGGISCSKSDASHGSSDFWIIWTDTTGAIIKDTVYGGTAIEQLSTLEVLPDSGYIIGGLSNSGSGTYKTDAVVGGGSNPDYWMVRINKNGTKLWDQTIGGTSDDFGVEIALIIEDTSGMGRGNLALTGFVMGGYSTSDSSATGDKKTRSKGSEDYWVVRTDDNGNLEWERTFGGSHSDKQTAMSVDHLGNYWIAGNSKSNNTGNKTTTNYGATTTTDYWVLKGKDYCTHDSICFTWVPLDTIPDSLIFSYDPVSCDSMGSEVVMATIQTQLGQYLQDQQDVLKADYLATCAAPDSISDTLSLTYPLGYHHYTLYYYDRAQNLVRTVPPAGVVSTSTNRNTHPAHTFVTKYKYNSLKQLVQQYTPDGDTTDFYYDSKGQLRFSQNKKQLLTPQQTPHGDLPRFSYTQYDKLGRIIEVGETTGLGPGDDNPFNYADSTWFPGGGKQEVHTVYTTPASNIFYLGNKSQRYLQNRVSYTYADEDGSPLTTGDMVYTYFSYDPHGNVEWLIQDIPGLGKNYTRYEYDLVSNKVLRVHYNEGAADEFHHKFDYDEDQRIKKAETSWGPGSNIAKSTRQHIGWDLDAQYAYYKHGPLRRMEIGEDKIQGLDYVYALQGWLKGLNHPTLKPYDDPGGDGRVSSSFPADAFGMVLGYHANDFNRSDTSGGKYNPSYSKLASSAGSISNLFNGNISSWTLQTDTISGNYSKQMGMKYRYDQLNRIKTEDYNEFSSSTWSNPSNTLDNIYKYDGNGRITEMTRKGTGNDRDALMAHYYANTNRLEYVDDSQTNTLLYGGDIEDQSSGNYEYTAIGERAKDTEGGIDTITWTVYGKMKALKKSNGDSLSFTYDAMSNRVMKWKKSGSDTSVIFYIRDVSGNIMSQYERTSLSGNYVYKQSEISIYGSSRIGEFKPDITIKTGPIGGSCCGGCTSCIVYPWTINVQKNNGYFARNIFKKEYELNDHLGNVHITVSDRKDNDNFANLLSYTNYYAFGTELTGKSYSSNSYSFGYNGKLKDDDVFDASGTFYDYGERGLDMRGVPSPFTPDPMEKKYPDLSPYGFADNSPIWKTDMGGDSTVFYSQSGQLLYASNDKFRNALVVVPDKNIVRFKADLNQIKLHKAEKMEASTQQLRNIGTSYMVQDYRDFFTQYHGKSAPEDAVKYTEAGSALEDVNGQMKLAGGVSHASPANVLKAQQQIIMAGDNPRLHTHPDAVPGSLLNAGKVPSNTDKQNAPTPDEPFMNVMVRPDQMFIYKTNITFVINSDIFKNPPTDLTNSDLMLPKSKTPATKATPKFRSK